jgi:cystathionine beta-lyase/cystathionine gamma-synthase
MNWCGGLFSAYLKTTDIGAVEKFCEQLNYFKMAVSWGGHESLLMPACAFYTKDFEGLRKYPFNLIRFYIGLENGNDLIEDLNKALEHL